MWLDVLTDALEKLVDALRERWPRAMFWTVVVLWSAAAALPTLGAALTGAGWVSVLIPLAPLVVIALTWWRGVARIPSPVWIAALTVWALLPGGLTYAKSRSETVSAGITVFLFCYGQLLVALLRAICVRRRFSLQTPFVQLRLMRLRLVAAAFPLAASFRADPSGAASGRGWHAVAVPVVLIMALAACAFPSRRKALLAAIAIAAGAWAVVAYSDPHERWSQLAENGWLWATGCYQWLRASRQDFWRRQLRFQ
ncbi:MAG: hypothetical protein HOV87_34360 [Catenulispora sp.]|nr:hypothetical protein [Catenulispora sp.]